MHTTDVVPNVVHYVLLAIREIQFSHFVSILSVLRNQKPDAIYIHCDCHHMTGHYYDRVMAAIKRTKTKLILNQVEKPTEILGIKIRDEWLNWHGSDLLRMRTLLQYGGIYLDQDVYVVKPFNDFFRYDFTMDFEVPFVVLGTQVLLARQNATAVQMWLDTYEKYYNPDKWYDSVGRIPVRLVMNEHPELVNRLNGEFGVQGPPMCIKLYLEYLDNWRDQFYAVHFVIRGDVIYHVKWCFDYDNIPKVIKFDEHIINQLNNTFGEMVREVFEYERKLTNV